MNLFMADFLQFGNTVAAKPEEPWLEPFSTSQLSYSAFLCSTRCPTGSYRKLCSAGDVLFYHPMIFPLNVKIKILHEVEPEIDEKKVILDMHYYTLKFCKESLESVTSSKLFSSNVFSAGQFDQFHCNVSRASSKLVQEIKMHPEIFGSSRISLNHSLQVAVAFFLGANGR